MMTEQERLEDDYVQTDLHLTIKFVNESSSRIRWILIILIIASCLGLACFWNSLHCSWKHSRVETLKEYINVLDNLAKRNKFRDDFNLQLVKTANRLNNHDTTSIINTHSNFNPLNDSLNNLIGFNNLLYTYEKLLSEDIKTKPNFDTTFYSNYYGKDALGIDNLRLMYLANWVLESKDIRSFKIPFFDVNFDINDLGFIGGLGFSIILLIFYLSLTRGKENIKIAFKSSKLEFKEDYIKRRQFYYLLSMNQLIIMPHIMNKKEKRYLKILPFILLCFPFIFSLCVFINDIRTNGYGFNISPVMTYFEYIMSSVFLILIIIFTIICIFELYSVDQLWKEEKIWLDNKQIEIQERKKIK